MKLRYHTLQEWLHQIKKIFPTWTANRWIAFTSIIVAVCALSVSIYTAWLGRDYLRRSQQPEMLMSFMYHKDGAGFFFGNVGLGPAKLEWFQILVDEQPQQDWAAMLRAIGVTSPTPIEFSFPGPIYLVDSFKKVFWVEPGPAHDRLWNQQNRIELRACYCSLFDECWISSNHSAPSRTNSCQPVPSIRSGGAALHKTSEMPIPDSIWTGKFKDDR